MTWLTLVASVAVVAINLAGLWEITTARRSLLDSTRRLLALETAARAGAIEARLAQTRGDLAFMAGSPIFFDLEAVLASRDPREVRWRRLEAEGAVLMFLRGHGEVMRSVIRAEDGRPLIEAARRGGVPVLWMSAGVSPAPVRREPDPVLQPIEGRFEPRLGTRTVQGAVTVEAIIDATRLMATGRATEPAEHRCVLRDLGGQVLAMDTGGRQAAAGLAGVRADGRAGGRDDESAEATVAADGWSVPGPWTLACRGTGTSPFALLEPLALRYRTTLLLNLMVMSLAAILGAFAIQQARRRREIETAAREEARVRELERRLFHSERLALVGRLAAGMAHEINNPLEGMSNYLTLAREALTRGDGEAARRRLDGVEEGMRRAGAIIRQVLTHADPATAPASPVDVAATARQAAEFVSARPEFAALRFELDLPPGLPPVSGRATLLGQVFLNLVLNACEAQPRGGEVRLSARAGDGVVTVEIADRGPGVPADESSRIFEPFYSTKRSSGLGLSVCHAIVTQHGGTIAVLDRPGGGALFRIELPASAPDRPPAPGTGSVRSPGAADVGTRHGEGDA
jgi:signal transduction histidine kinase